MIKFNVCFERITQESAEQGDYDECGFLAESIGLREALDIANIGHAEPNDARRPRWFTFYGDMDSLDGSFTNHSLHLPDGITAASALRIARLIGALAT